MNSTCERREELLISLLYEEGDPQELAEARAHLASCSDCRLEYENLLETRKLMGAWPNVVNVPRLVYVTEPAGFITRVRRWVDEMGSFGLRSLVRPATTVAAVAVVAVVAFTVLRFQVGSDGVLQVGFGKAATPQPSVLMAEDMSTGMEVVDASQPITRQEFNDGMVEMAGYLTELIQTTRAQDQQAVMVMLEERMEERDIALQEALMTAVNDAFTQMNQYGQRIDLLTASFQDLYDITGTELQKTNAILAALLQQGGVQERK